MLMSKERGAESRSTRAMAAGMGAPPKVFSSKPGPLQCESALGGERLCGELGRLRMVEILLGAVVLRVLTGECARGFKNTAYWPGVGVMEFWRKRVRRNVLRRGGELSQLSTVAIAGTLCCLLLGACADSMQPADGPRLEIHLDDEYVVRDPERVTMALSAFRYGMWELRSPTSADAQVQSHSWWNAMTEDGRTFSK